MEVCAHVTGGLVAQAAILFESLADDFFKLRDNLGIQADRGDGRFFEDGGKDDSGGIAAKWKRAGDHLIEHRAETEKVGARIELLAASLLGRHIGDGADSEARTGEMSFVHSAGGVAGECSDGFAGLFQRGLLGEAKVEDFGVAARG